MTLRTMTSVTALLAAIATTPAHAVGIVSEFAWSQSTTPSQVPEGNGAEIVAYDKTTGYLAVTRGDDKLSILDVNTGEEVQLLQLGGNANSVSAFNGVFAVAIENSDPQGSGTVEFHGLNQGNIGPSTVELTLIKTVNVGPLPDMLTFTPDGTKVIVANEGEPNDEYTVDPEGSVSIIDVSGGVENATVQTADFKAFNDKEADIEANFGRVFGPNNAPNGPQTATVAQDLEPEYIAVSPDGKTAVVTLQENNAVAIVDLHPESGELENGGEPQIVNVKGLGRKDWSGQKLDPSNRDDKIEFRDPQAEYGAQLYGLYQPDSIDSFEIDGKTYYAIANEGDARDYDGFSEEKRIGGEVPGEPYSAEEQLGRLRITNSLFAPEDEQDYDNDTFYSYGGRSLAILDDEGNLIADTGSEVSMRFFEDFPDAFDDNRSDDKGPEPEALTIGTLTGFDGEPGPTVAFLGLERAQGISVVQLWELLAGVDGFGGFNYLGSLATEGSISPEGLQFISAADLNNGDGLIEGASLDPLTSDLLVVTNEVSNTVDAYRIQAVPEPGTLALVGAGLAAAGAFARRRRA